MTNSLKIFIQRDVENSDVLNKIERQINLIERDKEIKLIGLSV